MSETNEAKKGRVRLTCGCGKEFSTHSSNRTVCHTCLPKCQEIHCFRPIPGGTITAGGRLLASYPTV